MLVSLSTLLRGTKYEKLKWTFTLYDLNKDGYITKQEILNVKRQYEEIYGTKLEDLAEVKVYNGLLVPELKRIRQ